MIRLEDVFTKANSKLFSPVEISISKHNLLPNKYFVYVDTNINNEDRENSIRVTETTIAPERRASILAMNLRRDGYETKGSF